MGRKQTNLVLTPIFGHMILTLTQQFLVNFNQKWTPVILRLISIGWYEEFSASLVLILPQGKSTLKRNARRTLSTS